MSHDICTASVVRRLKLVSESLTLSLTHQLVHLCHTQPAIAFLTCSPPIHALAHRPVDNSLVTQEMYKQEVYSLHMRCCLNGACTDTASSDVTKALPSQFNSSSSSVCRCLTPLLTPSPTNSTTRSTRRQSPQCCEYECA